MPSISIYRLQLLSLYCVSIVKFSEGNYNWQFHLVFFLYILYSEKTSEQLLLGGSERKCNRERTDGNSLVRLVSILISCTLDWNLGHTSPLLISLLSQPNFSLSYIFQSHNKTIFSAIGKCNLLLSRFHSHRAEIILSYFGSSNFSPLWMVYYIHLSKFVSRMHSVKFWVTIIYVKDSFLNNLFCIPGLFVCILCWFMYLKHRI